MIQSCICECLTISQIVEVANQMRKVGTSLVVQWLRLCADNAGGVGLIPGQGIKIPHAMQHNQKVTKLKISNKK